MNRSRRHNLLAKIHSCSMWLCIPNVEQNKNGREAAFEFLRKGLKCENPLKMVGEFHCTAGPSKDSKKIVLLGSVL